MKKNTQIKEGSYCSRRFILAIRNLLILIFFFSSGVLASPGYSQSMFFDINKRDVTIEQLFREIENNSEFSIIYRNSDINLKERVSVHVQSEKVEPILDDVLKSQGLNYVINDKHIILYKDKAFGNEFFESQQNSKNVTGVVKDISGEGLIGVTVLEKGTQNGTVTDINGNYSLQTDGSNPVLAFSCVGYLSKEMAVGNSNTVSIILEEDVQRLDDVVVIGYAIGNKRSVSGAVERVRKEEMNTGVISRPLDALKGKIAGVVISNVGGDPTADLNFRIRGTTSLSGGNDPLVIIDGVFGDMAMLNAISPADIEAMTILKDASETAQYGSRGASGVIVVSTIRGKSGFSQIEYNGLFGINAVYKNLAMLSADEWRAGASNLGLATNDLGARTNWYEEIERNSSLTQTHNFSFSNGNENGNFRASLGAVIRPGLLINSGSNSYTTKVDATQYGFNKKVKLELGLFGARRENDQQWDSYRTFYSAAAYNPTYPNYKNPETGVWDEDQTALEVYNPLGMMDVTNKRISTHMNVNGKVTYTVIEGLQVMAFGSYTYYSNNQRVYLPNDIQQGKMNGNGMARLNHREQNDLMGNLQVTYLKDIGKHSINALALLETQQQTYLESMQRSYGFETNYFKYNNLQAGANVSWGDVTSAAAKYRLLSYMARINYMYDGKYVVTGNLRRDGSSKLGNGNKWGVFPSVSAAWIVSNEGFLSGVSLINNLKLRVGYGVTGNQDAIDPYTSLALMEPNGTTLVDGSPTTTFAIRSNSNPELRWEKKYTFDVGFDLSLFDSRLRMTADYYLSTTKDMLYNYTVPVPPFTYERMLANLGEMKNNGFELSVNGDIIRQKDFGFSLGSTIAIQKNKLVSLSGSYRGSDFTTSKYIELSKVNASGLTQYAGVTYLIEGQPIGVFYIPKANGLIEKEPGKMVYDLVDLNDDGKIDLSDSGGDRYIAGQALPKVYLGANFNIRYKNFELTSQWNGAFGHKIYNGTSLTFNNLSLFPTYNVMKGALDKQIYDIKISDYYLEKGDYVAIDYITLSYNFPANRLTSFFIKGLRLGLSVNNVATITGYSGMTPMINSMNTRSESSIGGTMGLDDKLIYPLSRTYSLSVNAKF